MAVTIEIVTGQDAAALKAAFDTAGASDTFAAVKIIVIKSENPMIIGIVR